MRLNRFAFLATALTLAALPVRAETPPGEQPPTNIRSSVVRINTTSMVPDYRIPWIGGRTTGGSGAGFVIDGKRIMTNAHVVSNARFLTVEREEDPNPHLAKVKFVAHDADLAILELEDEKFFEKTKPLSLGNIPEIESTVSVYGYPIGGDRLSVTRGIVSRIDFQTYSHSGADSHLAIQIDAAINPGNSGGPVMQDGKVVGVAFQGYSGDVAQNTGYMIPVPVVQRFLKDVEDGKYDRYVDLAISYFPLLNPAQRKELNLPDDNHGVLVTRVYEGGSCDGVLQKGDVIVKLDGNDVDSDGSVQLDGKRVEMPEIAERKFVGDKVKLDILRDGQPLSVEASLVPAHQFIIHTNAYDIPPRFVVFSGLIFQPLDRDLMQAVRTDDLRVRYFYENYVSDSVYLERPEVILLSNILPDPVNSYLKEFRGSVVDEINGVKIRTLEDVQTALEKQVDYHLIKFVGVGRPAIIENAQVASAEQRINQRYGVLKSHNLEGKR